MIRAIFQFLLTLAKTLISFKALIQLVKLAWGLFLKLFRRGFTIVSPVLAFVKL